MFRPRRPSPVATCALKLYEWSKNEFVYYWARKHILKSVSEVIAWLDICLFSLGVSKHIQVACHDSEQLSHSN